MHGRHHGVPYTQTYQRLPRCSSHGKVCNAMYCMGMGGVTLVIAVVYGWQCSPEAARSDDILTIIQMHFEALPPGPKAIAGDLNGNPEAFSTITTLTSEYGWADVGMVGKLCKGEPGQYTCHANEKSHGVQHLFFLCQRMALPCHDCMRGGPK